MMGGSGREKGGDDRELTVTVVRGGGEEARTLRIPYRRLRWYVPIGVILGVAGALMMASWGYLAVRAAQTRALEDEVARLRQRDARVEELAQSLSEVEAAYDRLRALFGADAPPDARDLWLPPPAGQAGVARSVGEQGGDPPTNWPLTERGFVTQALLAGANTDHPGVDIAIPSGSYVRAAGGGIVTETGDDGVYGNFLVVDHGGGYRTRYAHASMILAEEGQPVSSNEVIALSGSSGRSTAPHLHFEILQDGVPIDPLTLVTQP